MTMDDVVSLFLSLPSPVQAHFRAAADRPDPANLRGLTREIYLYVQSLDEAQRIVSFLVTESRATTH